LNFRLAKCIREGVGRSTKEGLIIEVENFSKLFGTDESREGLTAFIEKRSPNFRN
jgi:1,4-dihydroxy-2-naphthoyl-CoA synthase